MREDWFEGALLRRAGDPSAPKAICLHGFADDGTAFAPLDGTVLTEDFELIAVDLPGFGASDAATDARIAPLAQFVLRLAEAISPSRRVALIGHSIGSAIAVEAARARPDRVGAVLSIEGNLTDADAYFSGRAAGYDDEGSFKSEFVADVERMAADQPALTRYLAAVRRADPTSMWTLGRDAAERGEENAFGRALLVLPGMGVAVTYLWGRHNTPASTIAFVDEHLANSDVASREFTKSGHWKSVDAPDATGRIARDAFAPLAA